MIAAVGPLEVLTVLLIPVIILGVVAGLVLFVRWVWRSGTPSDDQ